MAGRRMDRKTADSLKRLCLLTLSLTLAFGLLPFGSGRAEETGKTETVSASFPYFAKVITRDYPYCDDFFLQPSDTYNHPFAQLSVGMAFVAFRDTDHPEAQDGYLIEALENAGFGEIDTQPYRKNPTAYSIFISPSLSRR